MPNEKRKAYPILEHLSREELEDLIMAEPDGSDADVAFIKELMEVMETVEGKSGTSQVDADDAWREFQESYQNRSETFSAGKICEQPSPKPDQIKKLKRLRNFARYIAIAAIVIVLMSGIASALGVNILQAFASWTEETFSFISGKDALPQERRQAVPENDVFGELRTAVSEYTEHPLIPIWAPEGTEATDSVKMLQREEVTVISEMFKSSSGYFSIKIHISEALPANYTRLYQKDDDDIQLYEAGGMTHYIFSNHESNVAAWTYEAIEAYIQGDLSNKDLEGMVDSIYWSE